LSLDNPLDVNKARQLARQMSVFSRYEGLVGWAAIADTAIADALAVLVVESRPPLSS
jgi:hypothetical protein